MAHIEIYTKPTCGFLSCGKALVGKQGAVLFRDKYHCTAGQAAEMIQRAGGRSTVPQIFIDGTHVGGLTIWQRRNHPASSTSCWLREGRAFTIEFWR